MNPNSMTPESPYMLAAGNDYYEYKGWRIVWNHKRMSAGVVVEHVNCNAWADPELGIAYCPQCRANLSRETWEHLRRAWKFLRAPI